MTDNKRIKNVIAAHFAQFMPELAKNPDMSNDMHLENDLGADSLDVLELVMAIEDASHAEVPDKWLPGIKTVRHLLSSEACTHPSKGIGCPKTACMSCEFVIAKREAA